MMLVVFIPSRSRLVMVSGCQSCLHACYIKAYIFRVLLQSICRELHKATSNFTALLGQGAFGPVYKAILQPSGTILAVKVLAHQSKQGDREFQTEVALTLATIVDQCVGSCQPPSLSFKLLLKKLKITFEELWTYIC